MSDTEVYFERYQLYRRLLKKNEITIYDISLAKKSPDGGGVGIQGFRGSGADPGLMTHMATWPYYGTCPHGPHGPTSSVEVTSTTIDAGEQFDVAGKLICRKTVPNVAQRPNVKAQSGVPKHFNSSG